MQLAFLPFDQALILQGLGIAPQPRCFDTTTARPFSRSARLHACSFRSDWYAASNQQRCLIIFRQRIALTKTPAGAMYIGSKLSKPSENETRA